MGASSSYVSGSFCTINVVTMATFSLGYEGEEVPGEVRALEINPVMPQQVCPVYKCIPCEMLCHQFLLSAVFISESLGGEISLQKFSPKMLKHKYKHFTLH